MANPISLHLITDLLQDDTDRTRVVSAALRGGVDWVHIRDGSAAARDLFRVVSQLLPVAHAAGVGVLVNDRLDVALAAGADGVHLAGHSLPVGVARPLIGDRLLGVSVHSVAEARDAAHAGADYVTFGHVFATSSKSGLPPQGVAALADVVASVAIPVIAIGGIDADTMAGVMKTGCAGIAVISAIGAAPDPRRATARLRSVLDTYHGTPRFPFPIFTERGHR